MNIKSNVFFGELDEALKDVGPYFVSIYKSSNNWNDFGVKAFFNLKIFRNGKRPLIIEDGYKVIFDGDETRERVENLQYGEKISAKDLVFLGQVQDEKNYREIAYYLDEEESVAISLLKEICDAAILRESGESDALKLTEVEAFYEVLLRSSGAYYAYTKGIYSIFSGRSDEVDVGRVFEKPLTFNLKSELADYELLLDYSRTTYLPHSINLLVGPNASGKSYSIQAIVEKVFGYRDKESIKSESRGVFNRLVLFSNTIQDQYLSTKHSVRNLLNPKSEYHYLNLISQKKFDLQFGVRTSFTTSWALHDILWRDWHESGYFDKWKVLLETLELIIDFDNLIVPSKKDKYRSFEVPQTEQRRMQFLNDIDKKSDLLFEKNGKIFELSSGQHLFVRFAFYGLALLEQNSLLIVDEPENFLHPNYEIEFVKILRFMLEKTGSVSLLATHSPVITREIPSRNITIFSRDEDGIFVGRPKIETFANNLHKISSYIFGDLGSDKLYDKYLMELVDKDLGLEEFVEKMSKSFDADIVSVLINKYISDEGDEVYSKS
ncbi:MAG: AAA family ATPase [Marinobacter sp.]